MLHLPFSELPFKSARSKQRAVGSWNVECDLCTCLNPHCQAGAPCRRPHAPFIQPQRRTARPNTLQGVDFRPMLGQFWVSFGQRATENRPKNRLNIDPLQDLDRVSTLFGNWQFNPQLGPVWVTLDIFHTSSPPPPQNITYIAKFKKG